MRTILHTKVKKVEVHQATMTKNKKDFYLFNPTKFSFLLKKSHMNKFLFLLAGIAIGIFFTNVELPSINPYSIFITLLPFLKYTCVTFLLISCLLILIPFFLAIITCSAGRTAAMQAISNTMNYYRCLSYYWISNGTYEQCPYFQDNVRAKVQIYSLALIMRIWDKDHYRNGDFQEDMIKNLRDVALPGTGIPLSYFAYHKILTYFFLLVLYPTVAWIAAFNRVYHNNEEEPTEYTKHSKVHHLYQCYNEQLIEPRDWFSYWRLNCRLATYHSYVTGKATKENYDCEDKWKFLIKSKEKDIAVTPWLDVDIICKDRNEEGGLGFKAFKNAANTEHNNGTGGQWIIQEKLKNGKFLSSMLPKTNPPLSTFRIISSSKGGLHVGDCTRQDIKALSCVWRAGRANAATDHTAILFNVHPTSGEILKGTLNTHWYHANPANKKTTLSTHSYTHHPDTNGVITGQKVTNIKEIMDFVEDAHYKLIPHVPLCGWDVALCGDDDEKLLLEGNFSCNFFRGTFDEDYYFNMVEEYFIDCEKMEGRGGKEIKKER